MIVAVVRRLIVFLLLFALTTIAAIGLAGLLERVIGFGSVLVDDSTGLARSLAFVLIGAPLAWLLWWWERRRLSDDAERSSLLWSLYLAAMTLTSLIVFAGASFANWCAPISTVPPIGLPNRSFTAPA